MSNKISEYKSKVVESGRIKETSAFNIQQADELREVSWSNNNSASAKLNKEESSTEEHSKLS